MNINTTDVIKENVGMKDLIRHLGIKITRAGFVNCPFHSEKTPSMKIYDNSFYCFGCGVGGDVITFIEKYLKCGFKSSVSYLNEVFALGLNLYKTPNNKELDRLFLKKFNQSKTERWIKETELILIKYYCFLYRNKKTDESIKNISIVEYLIECISEDPIWFYKTNRKEMKKYSDRVKQLRVD